MKTNKIVAAVVESILFAAGASEPASPLALFRATHGAASVRVSDVYTAHGGPVTMGAPDGELYLLVPSGTTTDEANRAAAWALAANAIDDLDERTEIERAYLLARVEATLMDPLPAAA